MTVHVMTPGMDSNFWKALIKSKDFGCTYHEGKTLSQVLKQTKDGDFLYWEYPETESEAKKGLKQIQKTEGLLWAVVDSQGLVEDVAELFAAGASDYLGPALCSESFSMTRFNKVSLWRRGDTVQSSDAPAGFTWAEVKNGQEYGFQFLLVSLSNVADTKKRFGEKRFHQFLNEFKSWLGRSAQEEGGQFWMDMETSFLVLFPDNPDPLALVYGFKLLLARMHLGVEFFRLDQALDLTLALHRGRCTWLPPGQTGTVVSDAVNSIFHLGQKFAPENTFCFTEDCMNLVPGTFETLVMKQGAYEGRNIFRFRKPLFHPLEKTAKK